MTDTLRASAALEPATIVAGEDFVVHVTISNISDAPVRLSCLFLGYATLMLRITDLDGNAVPPGPPPLPPRDDGQIGRSWIAPGESFTIDYHGGNYSPQRLAPGRYWVRFRHTCVDKGAGDWTGVLASEWLGLEVRA